MALTRSIGAYDDGTPSVPGVGTTPLDTRKSLSALWASAGVVPGGPSPLVTGTAGFAYSVAGPVPFVTTRGPSDGFHMFTNDGATSVTCPGAPGSGLQRIDVVWVRHPTNAENSDTSSQPIFGVASGTAASSSPAVPSIPTGALELARNTMTSAATSTASAGNLIAQTALYTVAAGAPIPVRSQAERDALTPYDGLQVYRLDTHAIETNNQGAGAWQVTAVTDDTGWIALPLASPWVWFGAYALPRYRRKGGVVFVEGAIKGGSSSASALFAGIPAGFRPASTLQRPAVIPGAATANIEIRSTGDLAQGDTGISGTLTYINAQFIAEA